MQRIAEAVGVSPTTVSHALSGKRPVNPETAARIRSLIEQLEYVPDAAALRLQSGRSRIVGLAVPDIAHWYFGCIAKGVEEVADDADYGLVVTSTVNADPRREKRYFNMLKNRTVDGLIYTASRSTTDVAELMKHARSAPLVLADDSIAALPDVPSVTSTVAEGALAAGEHLRALGHTRAVVIAGYPGLRSTDERLEAFRRVMPNALTLHGDFEEASGYRLVSELLANEVRFTCVFAHNDFMAVGAMRRLKEAGLRIPEDVSVIGFDDSDIATIVEPGLTTVRKDMVEVGRAAARILFSRLDGDDAGARSRVLPVELIVRGSTGPSPLGA